jgi:ketosteroid isomerase-like protein
MPRCYGARPYIEAAVADTTSIIALLEGVCDAFNAHDLDQVMKFFAEDCILLMPRGPDPHGRRYEGKAAVREGLATRFAGLPDVHFGQATHYACGDTGISKWTITGTTPSGEQIEALGCDFYTFREGAVIAKDSYWKRVEPA